MPNIFYFPEFMILILSLPIQTVVRNSELGKLFTPSKQSSPVTPFIVTSTLYYSPYHTIEPLNCHLKIFPFYFHCQTRL